MLSTVVTEVSPTHEVPLSYLNEMLKADIICRARPPERWKDIHRSLQGGAECRLTRVVQKHGTELPVKAKWIFSAQINYIVNPGHHFGPDPPGLEMILSHTHNDTWYKWRAIIQMA